MTKKTWELIIDNLYNFLESLLEIGKAIFEIICKPLFIFFTFIFVFVIGNEIVKFSEQTINSIRILMDLYIITWVAKIFHFCFTRLKRARILK